MPPLFAPFLRACCVAGAIASCLAVAAEHKPSLIGATREEILARFGEPKSQITAGSREVLFFATERVVLRENRVIEAEEIAAETPSTLAAAKPAPAAKLSSTTVTDSASTAQPDTTTTEPARHTSAPVVQPARVSASAATSGENTSTTAAQHSSPTVTLPPEVQIKSVRPPTKPFAATVPVATSSPKTAPTASAGGNTRVAQQPGMIAPATTTALQLPASGAAPVSIVPVAAPAAVTSTTPVSEVAASTIAADVAVTEPVAAKKQTPPVKKATRVRAPHAEPEIPDTTEAIFTIRTYLITLLIIGTGIGYLLWRRRQRQLVLDVTAVSRSPFAPELPASNGNTRFTADLLSKLERSRFEELVVSYYNKTGVVASHTKTLPSSAAHIRISWKGEQRPFACAHCVAQPTELIGTKPIEALCEVLAAEDIRRGYIVTPGKFSVEARDLAEEKHVTLLPGDIFMEKLNAMPEAARAELLRDAMAVSIPVPEPSAVRVGE